VADAHDQVRDVEAEQKLSSSVYFLYFIFFFFFFAREEHNQQISKKQQNTSNADASIFIAMTRLKFQG
jgi:hypothetical protein